MIGRLREKEWINRVVIRDHGTVDNTMLQYRRFDSWTQRVERVMVGWMVMVRGGYGLRLVTFL